MTPPSRTRAGRGRPAGQRRPVWIAAGLAVAAVLTAALWWAEPFSDRVDLGPASVAMLDTVRVDGRVVVASLDGTVQGTSDDGTVFVGTSDRAFAVRGAAADSLAVEDRVLVVGRVRGGAGGRFLDTEALVHVVGADRPGRRRSGERPTVQPDD